MIKHKIIEINKQGPCFFMEYLQYLFELKSWSATFETQNSFNEQSLKGGSAFLVGLNLSVEILPKLKFLPSQVQNLGVLDTIFQEKGAWYPRSLLYEALRNLIVAQASDLDIRSPAFIVGSDERVRVIVSVLANMGIDEFYLVGDEAVLQHEKELLLRSQLGLKIKSILPEQLTDQITSAGIVVNLIDLAEQTNLFMDLSYFNFMGRCGYVLELNLGAGYKLLLDEAENAGHKILSPLTFYHFLTRVWLEYFENGLYSKKITDQELQDSWSSFLNKISPSV